MKTLVVAPHPDDELLGCGGTMLRRKAEGAELGWLIVTAMSEEHGWSAARVQNRKEEIETVTGLVGFHRVFNLGLPPAALDSMSLNNLISRVAPIFEEFQPTEVFVPSRSDAHTDHRIVFDAVTACTKWFRHSYVSRVLAYQTISETGFGLDAQAQFHPNVFIDISAYLEQKLKLLATYQSEMGVFPFPRSVEAIRALAQLHGSSSGFHAAEAFQLLRERQ